MASLAGEGRPSSPLPPGSSVEDPIKSWGHKMATAGLTGLLLRWAVRGKSSSWLSSALIHTAIVLVLSLIGFGRNGDGPTPWLVGSVDDVPISNLSDLESETLMVTSGGSSSWNSPGIGDAVEETRIPVNPTILPPDMPSWHGSEEAPEIPPAETISQPLLSRGGGLEGRTVGNRHNLALRGGGSEASESAVERGLAWLAAHQWEDGGWRFNLKATPACQGECRHWGHFRSTTASTGLALICFLGAGHTHQEGPYKETVAGGLYYLTDRMVMTSLGGDLRDGESGTMYSHAIATLALTEAVAMTGDATLTGPAQSAVDFIVHAQHPKGGWRYSPGKPGDTTVTGWHIAALKSALLARLEVPYDIWHKIDAFLDSVQLNRGAAYGYQDASRSTNTTNAIGLFGRMILGWPHDHRPLQRGMAQMAGQDPRKNHMYFNYYAAQILHHYGGKGWERWNQRTLKYLVEHQARGGHENGSWHFPREAHSRPGGRLYTTAMAIMTLEVYYRYMPLYQRAFVEHAP